MDVSVMRNSLTGLGLRCKSFLGRSIAEVDPIAIDESATGELCVRQGEAGLSDARLGPLQKRFFLALTPPSVILSSWPGGSFL